ncbi:AlpA family transcriptional regulator [Vibrio diazotrophicus]|uniref:AlpA family transcriptional regulator n=1 Tax=Vibrio diazotrophicus TaxID=685 RepID=UPI0022AEF468|nr:AlpA family transcriptional regulator [Vibrio diazotrophicus]MCZ4372310.1 AlpA family transcriptional regulator [Vibrio diazotrophicus]
MSKSANRVNRFIRLREVMSMTGLSKSSIYDYMNLGLFPTTISLGSRSVGWVESEIEQWMDNQIARRDQEVA